MSTGLSDVNDVRSIALLRQQRHNLNSSSNGSNLGNNHHVSTSASREIHQSSPSTDPSSMVTHGLSASELMSATSLHNRERQLMTAELLKQQHHHHYLGHREQVATAMALASRNHPFSTMTSHTKEQPQQSPGSREDLILTRAINQLSAVSRHHPLQQQHPEHDRRHLLHHHPAASSATAGLGMEDPSRRSTVYCAEPDLSPEKDICFGRGQRVQRRKANVAFRRIVATYQTTYDQAVSREDKKAVVKKVSRIFSRTGYRFFKESEDTALYGQHGGSSKMWVAVLDSDVEYKIGHSFRSGRKQIKQQQKHNQQRNQAKGGEDGGGGAGATADWCSSGDDAKGNSSSEDLNKKSPSRSMVKSELNNNSNNNNDCVLKEDELSDKCICIGDKREKYTGMEAYQYFREFILTFKSIIGDSESVDEKTKTISSLIDQFKSDKGYRFLKLMSMKKDVEFWVEASTDDIQCEVLFILGGNTLQSPPNEEKSNSNRDGIKQDDVSKKGQHLSPGRKSLDSFSRPSAAERVVTDQEPPRATKNDSDSKESLLPSKNHPTAPLGQSAANGGLASVSSSTSKMGRKRALSKATTSPQKPNTTWVPSEILCKPSVATGESIESNSKKTKYGTDAVIKNETAIHRPGLGVPPSLSLPSVLFGTMPLQLDRSSSSSFSRVGGGSHSLAAAADMASRVKMLPGRDVRQPQQLPGFGIPATLGSGGDTLGKALHAMRSSTSPSVAPNNHLARTATTNSERSLLVEKAKQFEAAKHFEMRANLLEHLKQQELLYIEKKHKLDMLDLQLQSPDSRM